MSIDVTVNGDTIGQVDIENRTRHTRPDDTNTYAWHYRGDGHRVLTDTVDHRYGDGAMVLASKVMAAIALRYAAATQAGARP